MQQPKASAVHRILEKGFMLPSGLPPCHASSSSFASFPPHCKKGDRQNDGIFAWHAKLSPLAENNIEMFSGFSLQFPQCWQPFSSQKKLAIKARKLSGKSFRISVNKWVKKLWIIDRNYAENAEKYFLVTFKLAVNNPKMANRGNPNPGERVLPSFLPVLRFIVVVIK